MIPPAACERYLRQWDMLARLAVWLRDQRAGRYDELVRAGHLTRQKAESDRIARADLADYWQAVAADRPRDASLRTTPLIRRLALEGAIAGVETRLRLMPEGDAAWGDNRDLRDALACLLLYERSTLGGPLFAQDQARAEAAAREEAA